MKEYDAGRTPRDPLEDMWDALEAEEPLQDHWTPTPEPRWATMVRPSEIDPEGMPPDIRELMTGGAADAAEPAEEDDDV